jgi:hypothetical protein
LFKYTDGSFYEGDWINGKKHGTGGTGLTKWALGDSYWGEYIEGKQHGKGIAEFATDGQTRLPGLDYSWNAGDKYDGGYKACTHTFFNGETLNCTWVDGRCPEFTARQAALLAAFSCCCSVLDSLAFGVLARAFRKLGYTDEAARLFKEDHLTKLGLPLGKAVKFIAAF